MNMLFDNIKIDYLIKTLPQKGFLAYEYNPFRNYRVKETKYIYNGQEYTLEELNTKGITYNDSSKQWENSDNTVTVKVKHRKGDLVDFDTDELNFSLKHPINILPQYSYDGSVNLILNDGYNSPRLINSRFSVIGKQQYQIVDRVGNSDTNIYNQGEQFESNISLYKQINKIPKLKFLGVQNGGNMPIGNYHFYIRYLDADSNYTEFVAESGLVSIFIGTSPSGIKSGFRNENSLKSVKFYLSNIDTSYPYLEVYYTRATSDPNENYIKEAVKINKKYPITNVGTCNITINGYEETTNVDLSEINSYFNIINSSYTQAICQNRLFLGNVQKTEQLYTDLKDLALRLYPEVDSSVEMSKISPNYDLDGDNTYYSPEFIYNFTGYWPDEYYRLGVVFILSDFSLSSVYNIRGLVNGEKIEKDSSLFNKDIRKYLKLDEERNKAFNDSTELPGNTKGVFQIKSENQKSVLGIQIKSSVNFEELKNELKRLNVQGLFFVRQTRIPNTICQALTIATDKESHTPVIPIGDSQYLSERFLNDSRILDFNFNNRKFISKTANINAAICPEYDLNYPYLNQLFLGDYLTIQEASIQPSSNYLTSDPRIERHFYNDFSNYVTSPNETIKESKVIGIQDNTKLIAIDDTKFSSRVGSSEEAWRFEFIEKENKITEASNLLRGVFGPYIGILNLTDTNRIVNIKLKQGSLQEQLNIRIQDSSPYQAISDRISIDDFKEDQTFYRGDCYICQYTHRINRNFNDPSAHYNDDIVKNTTWSENFKYDKGTMIQDGLTKINLGDLNAVPMGMWITFTLRSNFNLCIRSTDDTYINEAAESGHSRGFYPLYPMSVDGTYKLPEALVYNKGFSVSLSELWNNVLPYSPHYRNDFTNRIMYSDINVTDEFKNGFRIFKAQNYRDYPKTYGQIIKIIEWQGNLLCVFEHGIALIPVNERSVAAEGPGGLAYINTNNVLPDNPRIISDMYGSQFADSIIKTQSYVYGVDTIAKKIWRTNGSQIQLISDLKVQEFLNNNITLSEREITPLIGIRNVKTFYNAFKQDIMFTYYDNIYGFEEKAWNLCYNESLGMFVTFYSWIPSMMENIDNIPFSFDRNTTKYIAKLGVSHSKNSFADGITLTNNVIPNELDKKFIVTDDGVRYYRIGFLVLENRIYEGNVTFTLQDDIWKNKQHFKIIDDGLYLKVHGNVLNSYKLSSEFYYRKDDFGNKVNDLESAIEYNYPIYKDNSGKRITLPYENQINPDKIVRFLNIRANISKKGDTNEWGTSMIEAGYYESTIAVITEWNKQFLTTDFWKHGQAGNIDISDDVYPTNWYGKQHPFEFEFIVVNDPATHKIFTNLELIANKAKPESFHYEIIGECFDFHKDKPNMYYRQEGRKHIWQLNGVDISYDHQYTTINTQWQPKSADLIHKYYARKDTINEIENYYIKKENTNGYDYRHLSGAEIIYYKNRQEYRICNHVRAISLEDNIIAANCRYLEDRWKTTINPILICYKNEDKWENKPPIPILNSIPDEIAEQGSINNLEGFDYDLTDWIGELDYNRREIDLRDRFIKIKVRYSGEELAVIDFLNTIYRISYA